MGIRLPTRVAHVARSPFLSLVLVFAAVGTTIAGPTTSSLLANISTASIPPVTAGLLGGLDRAGALFLNTVLWPRPQRSVWELQALFTSIAANPTSFQTWTSTGLAPLAIFVAVSLALFVICLFNMVLFPCCRLCNQCGGRKPKKYGYTRNEIIRTSITTAFLALVLVYCASVGIIYSREFTDAITQSNDAVNATVGAMSGLLENIPVTANKTADSMEVWIPGIANGFSKIPFTSQVVDPTIGPAYTNLQIGLNSTAGNLTNAQVGASSANKSIQGVVDASPNLQNSLTNLGSVVNGLNQITIDGQTYNLTGSPDASQVSPTLVPDLSGIPSLAPLVANLSACPDVQSLAANVSSQFRTVFIALPTQFANTVNAMIPPHPGDYLRNFSGPLTSSLGSVESTIANVNGTIASSFAMAVTYNNIRSTATGAYYYVFLGFCGLALCSVLIQKRKCMFLVMPVFLLFAVLAWPQFLVYFLVGVPVNELCYSQPKILATEFSLSPGASLSPQAILTSCQRNAGLLNLTVSENGNTTLLSVMGLGSSVGQLQNVTALKAMLSLPANLSDTIANSVNLTFQDPTTALTALEGQSFAFNGAGIAIPQNPFKLTQFVANVTSFAMGLTPSSINSSFSETTLSNDLANFNTAAALGNTSWVAWGFNDIVALFVNQSNSFSAQTYVTGSSSNSQNSNIDNKFNIVYPEVRYKQLALNAIQTLTATCQAVAANATTLITPLHQNLTWSQGNLTLLNTSLPLINSSVPLILNSSALVNASMPALLTQLATVVSAYVDSSLVTLAANVTDSINGGTSCYALGQGITQMLSVTCSTTLSSLNGSWMGLWLLGVLLLPAFGAIARASKRLGRQQRVIPVTDDMEKASLVKKSPEKGRKKQGTQQVRVLASARH